jgi:hypothetical protein
MHEPEFETRTLHLSDSLIIGKCDIYLLHGDIYEEKHFLEEQGKRKN